MPSKGCFLIFFYENSQGHALLYRKTACKVQKYYYNYVRRNIGFNGRNYVRNLKLRVLRSRGVGGMVDSPGFLGTGTGGEKLTNPSQGGDSFLGSDRLADMSGRN